MSSRRQCRREDMAAVRRVRAAPSRRHARRVGHRSRGLPRVRPPGHARAASRGRGAREARPRRSGAGADPEARLRPRTGLPREAACRRTLGPRDPASRRQRAQRAARGAGRDARGHAPRRRRHLPGDARRPLAWPCDFLVRRDDRPSDLGSWSYDVADTKLARRRRRRPSSRCVSTPISSRAPGHPPRRSRGLRQRDAEPASADRLCRVLPGGQGRFEGGVRDRARGPARDVSQAGRPLPGGSWWILCDRRSREEATCRSSRAPRASSGGSSSRQA